MPGETNLNTLLREMKPELNAGEYVFSLTASINSDDLQDLICFFREEEGTTVILPKQMADQANLPYTGTYSWITLTIHSSLEAVGLTAAVSQALTDANNSCNIVAAY